METVRRKEIDICKGILTITMILCHCIQFFGYETEGVQKILADMINLATFSGFLFCFGYVSDLAYYRKEWKQSAGKMLKNAVRILIAFYISGIAYVALVEQKIFRWDFIAEVLLLKKFPGWSEFLASFVAVLLVGILMFPLMKRINGWIVLFLSLLSILSCWLPYENIHNSWLALFVGSREFITFPVLQYFVYFVWGVWMCRKNKVWSKWVMLGTIVVSCPCIVFWIQQGYLPERFPPSWMFLCGGSVIVYVYYLISANLEKVRRKNNLCKWVALWLEKVGKASLYYLLLSNIFIFALDGSHFSFRSKGYAYTFFVIVILMISYLERLRDGKTKSIVK